MKAIVRWQGCHYRVDFSQPIDISLVLSGGKKNIRAWHSGPPIIEAVQHGSRKYEVSQGAAVNFRNIFFNPHSHTTHTECVGHITRKTITLDQCLKEFFMPALLISIKPVRQSNGDSIITREQLREKIKDRQAVAIILRTLPNAVSRQWKDYSGTNPPYLEPQAASFLRQKGFRHLLIDLPSVDREEDGGRLLAHRAFWNHPSATRKHCTITELIYVPDSVQDGLYFLNLVPARIANDAAPVRALLFKCKRIY
jgi:kynurenine formamidase